MNCHEPLSGCRPIRISVNCILNENVACCRNVEWIFHYLVLMIEIFRTSRFCHLPFVLSHIFTLSFLCYCFSCVLCHSVSFSRTNPLSLSLTHTQLSPSVPFYQSLLLRAFCGCGGETCFGGERYPDTFWMCLWTRWGQSQWCMAVIPILQRDTTVSCHGRQDDLYSAALLMAWYKWC